MNDLRTAAQQALEVEADRRRKALAAEMRAALAQQAEPPGCDHCRHPLYAATRCRVCGRVTEQAEPVEPVAYRHLHEDGWEYHDAPTGEDCAECQALYTAPPQQAEPDHETRAELAEQQVVQLAEERDHYRNLWQKAQQAEPVEPVAWVRLEAWKSGKDWPDDCFTALPAEGLTPLYTAPPQRKPLTDEEIDAVWDQWFGAYGLRGPGGPYTRRGFARAVERAHGIPKP